MDINFTGIYAQNENFGINFQAIVDEKNIACIVSTAALQDINPSRRLDGAEQQYLNNQNQLEAIARKKIQNGDVSNGKVFIDQSDVL